MAGSLGQADSIGPVDPWTTSAVLAGTTDWRKQPERRVSAQAAHHDHPQRLDGFEELLLGVGPIGHHPDHLAPKPQSALSPLQRGHGHLQLGLEDRAAWGGSLG